MSNAIATIDLTQLPSTQLGTDDAFADLTKGGNYLKYLKLCNNDKFTKKNKIANGHWGIPGPDETITDLGDSIDVVPFARRPKAVDMRDRSAIVTSYDETSDSFKKIRALSMEKDSSCQCGISFLVYERSTGSFYELFFGNATSLREAGAVSNHMNLTQADIDRRAANSQDVKGLAPHGPMPMTLQTRYIEKKGNSWYGPLVTKCSTPFNKVPPMTRIIEEIERFLKPKSEGVEKAEDNRKSRAR
jgi:hypothetical protein